MGEGKQTGVERVICEIGIILRKRKANRNTVFVFDEDGAINIFTMIHVIERLQLTDNGLVIKGTKQEVHLQQGAMDGACAVYSMMMCLIIIRSIHRNDVVTLEDEKIKGNTSKGRLIKTFLYHNGFVRGGYYLSDLRDELLHSYKQNVHVDYYSIEDGYDFIANIINALDNNDPVELAFQRKGKSGHAVVAIGYEKNSNGVLLYILDPGYPIPFGQYWNNLIQINTNSTCKYNALNFIEKEKIQVDEALVIKKKSKKHCR